MGLLIIIGVLVTVCISSILISGLVILAIPGRKGTLRTTREFRFPGKPDEAFALMRGRMEYDGFVVDSASPPRAISAHRAARHGLFDESIVTHASKPLGLEVQFDPMADGTLVRLTMWMKDFILLDSGEGRQIDLTLNRLITAELDKEPPPVTPSTSLNAIVGVTAALVTLALALLPFYWLRLREHPLAFGMSIIGAAMFSASMGWEAMKAIEAKPKEVTGRAWVYTAYFLSGLGILAGVAWLVWWLFRPR